tara:strand:- start:980 stop:1195 length:216 start_codon:yes stop_codon:yes gene_type:complete
MGLFGWMLLRTILFSIIGNSFYKWFQTTKWGIWFDKKLATFMNKVTDKEGQAQAKKDAKALAKDNENGRSS